MSAVASPHDHASEGPLPDPGGRLDHQLNSVLRHVRLVTSIKGLCLLISAELIIVVGFLYAMGWWGGQTLKQVGLITIGLCTAILTTWLLIRPLRNLNSPFGVIALIGRRWPKSRSAIYSAVQLQLTASDDPQVNWMKQRHIEQTIRQLDHLPLTQVVPWRQLIWPVIALLLILIVSGFTVQINWPIFVAGRENILSSDPTARPVVTSQSKGPVLRDISVLVVFPQYLNRPRQIHQSFSGRLTAPLGARITIDGWSLVGDISKAEIQFSNDPPIELEVNQRGRITGVFTVRPNSYFRLVLYPRSGGRVEGPRHTMVVQTDQHPTIRLRNTKRTIELWQKETLPIEFDAFDDHGITRIELMLRSGKSLNLAKTVIRCAPDLTQLRRTITWQPDTLRAKDLRSLELSIRVYDNDTISGPKFSESEPIFVTVMTPQNQQLDLMDRQQAVLDSLVDLLGYRLANPVSARFDKFDQIGARFAHVQEMTRDLLSSLMALEKRARKTGTAPQLADQIDELRHLLAGQLLDETRQNQLPLASYKARSRTDAVTNRLLERAVLRIDDLLADQQYTQATTKGKTLKQEGERLRLLIANLGRTGNEKQRRLINNTLATLEKTLTQLLNHLNHLQLQPGAPKMGITHSLAEELFATINEIQQQLANGDTDEAARLVAAVETRLTTLLAGLEQGYLNFKLDRFGPKEAFVSELVERLQTVESDQLQMRRRAVGWQRHYREKLLAMMHDHIDPLVAAQRTRVKQIRSAFERLSSRESEETARVLLELGQMTLDLENVLGQGDLDRAVELAHRITQYVETAHLLSGGLERQGLLDIARLSRQLGRKLSSAFPAPRKVIGKAKLNRVKQGAAKQRRLAGRVKNIMKSIDAKRKTLPFISGQAGSDLLAIVRHMDAATGNLKRLKLADAVSDQSRALDALLELKTQLTQGGHPVLTNRLERESPARVLIPDAAEFTVPAAQRDEIIKAMRHKRPKRYDGAIEQYYEALVR